MCLAATTYTLIPQIGLASRFSNMSSRFSNMPSRFIRALIISLASSVSWFAHTNFSSEFCLGTHQNLPLCQLVDNHQLSRKIVRFKAPHTVSSVAGKLGPPQAVNYRAKRVLSDLWDLIEQIRMNCIHRCQLNGA